MYRGKGRNVRRVLKSSLTNTGQRLTYPRTRKPQIESLLVEFAPRGQSGWHRHPHSTFVYVLKGTLLLENKGRTPRRYKAGSAFLEATNTWHNAKNIGTKPLQLLLVYLGEQHQPNRIDPK